VRCPNCSHEFGVEKGGLTLLPGISQTETTEDQSKTPKFGVRGPAREYSQAFEIAWKAYGKKVQKFEAFAIWLVRAKEVGGEPRLLTLILSALKWQTPDWATDGWKFAPYFERYLKRRKWEDEPAPKPQAVPRTIDRNAEATDRKIAEYRAAQGKPLTPEELADIRRRGVG
jgi:hypothetical protein